MSKLLPEVQKIVSAGQVEEGSVKSDRIITDELVSALKNGVVEFRVQIENSLREIAKARRKSFAAERLLDMAKAEGADVGDISGLRKFNEKMGRWKLPRIEADFPNRQSGETDEQP